LSTIYRVLVRHGLVDATPRRRRRQDYKRWQRSRPMELWQMDIVGGIVLADGGEAKVATGVDDHSRYCVIATVVRRATGRAVCLALVEALRRFGIPEEILTDNGKQFTGRFTRPRPGEVLFERICRENGIVARNTKPRSPTTTGKVERFHQTLRRELLDDVAVWPDLPTVQAAVDAFRHAYNTDRPHRSLDMAFPADRFTARPTDGDMPLRVPPSLVNGSIPPAVRTDTVSPAGPAPVVTPVALPDNDFNPVDAAVEVTRMVPASGNLAVCGQQFWLGPANAGRTITLWADTTLVHVLLDGSRVKTVPSRLTADHLRQLLVDGGRPAGPPPIAAGPNRPGGSVEVDRLVNATGLIGLAGRQHPIGFHLAGQRVTARLDHGVLHILDHQRTLLRTLPNPLTPTDLGRLRDARPAGPPPTPTGEPQRVDRRVSSRAALVVAGQRIHIGIVHAGRTVTVEAADHTFRVHDGDQLITEVARTTTKPITRFKVRKPQRTRQAGRPQCPDARR
jgi:transposase InsO family protein